MPVEGKDSFWDHQTPGWNHLWGSNGVGLCALGVLGTRERRKGGHARVRSIPATLGRFPTFYGAFESQ